MTSNELSIAQYFAEQGELDKAAEIAYRNLKKDPDSVDWIQVMTYVLLTTEKPAIAYQLAKRATQLEPKNAGTWMNLGMACRDMRHDEAALRYCKKGLKLSHDDEQKAVLAVNTASVLVDMGEFKEAEKYCRMGLKLNPDSPKSRANLGFCQLAQRKWRDGWKNYRYCLGHEWRPRHQYKDEPEWDGKGKGTIVLYGEQGLGDQISFASMLPEAMAWAEKNESRIILDVSNRLTALLSRSFPGLKVYGSQGKQGLYWDKEDQNIDYSLPIGQVGEYFRTTTASFPGTPFLIPDEDRVLQWQALFDSKYAKPKSCPHCGKDDKIYKQSGDGKSYNCSHCHWVGSQKKPVIGLAWSGGIPKTGSKFRRVDLEKLLPVLESVDAHWVSLQYKPAGKEIAAFKEKHPHIDIVEYKHGTLSGDYDDTVAMVAAMDHLVCMHTTIVHVAGGLGIPCWTFVPKNSQWRYGCEGEDFVWADSVRILRQTERGKWGGLFKRTAEELGALFSGIRETAGKTARERQLWSNRAKVRTDSIEYH